MNKVIALLISVIIVGALAIGIISTVRSKDTALRDYRNISYNIEGVEVKLTNGTSQAPAAPGSSAQIVTTYFGNLGKGDLNGDGIPDLAFLLTQTQQGSGTFFYVVAALQKSDGSYVGTNAVFIGDRVAPQTTEIRDRQITVNYADRRPDEPMTAQPSIGVSKSFIVSGEILSVIAEKVPPGSLGLGTYEYNCGDGVSFSMSPKDEMAAILIKPTGSAAFPPEAELSPIETPKGKTGHWFSDGEMKLNGKGEGITIENKTTPPLRCNPVASSSSAPWNWGD